MGIKAIIFDFDGVILETEGPVHQSWSELYQEFGLTLSMDVWAAYIGTAEGSFDPLEDIERQVGSIPDRERIALRRRQREDELVLSQPVMPGVEDFLRDARRLNLQAGIASSSSCDWVVGHLKRLGLLEYFSIIHGADDVQRAKPAPDLYLATLNSLTVPASQAFAVEDSPNGIAAAKQAGLFCIAVPHRLTSDLPLDHADMVLESLSVKPLESLIIEIEHRLNGN